MTAMVLPQPAESQLLMAVEIRVFLAIDAFH